MYAFVLFCNSMNVAAMLLQMIWRVLVWWRGVKILLIQTVLFRYHIMHSKVFCEESSSIDEERNLWCMVLQLSVQSVEMPSMAFVAFATSVAMMYPASGRLFVCCIEITKLLFNFSAASLPLVDSKCPWSIWWKSVIMFMTCMNLNCNLLVRDRVPEPPGKSSNFQVVLTMRTLKNEVHELDHSSMILRYLCICWQSIRSVSMTKLTPLSLVKYIRLSWCTVAW